MTQILSILILSIGAYYQYQVEHGQLKDSEKRRKGQLILIFTVSGFMITSIFQLLERKEDKRFSQSLINQNDSLRILIASSTEANKYMYRSQSDSIKFLYANKSDSLSNEIYLLQDSVNSQTIKLLNVYNNLFEKTEFIHNSLYGNGFARISRGPSIIDSSEKAYTSFFLTNMSEFPIYNLTVQIFNYDMLMTGINKRNHPEYLRISASDYKKAISFSFGPLDLYPHQTFASDFILENNYYISAICVITTRNGVFYQKLLHWFDNEYNHLLYEASQLYDSELNLVYSDVPEFFPEFIEPAYFGVLLDKIDIVKFKKIRIIDEESFF